MGAAEQTKIKMVTAIDHLKQELKNLRTGRANPGILDQVQVEVYGAPMRLKEVANITAPEARMLLVTPFDPQTAGAICKSIEKANLNLQPILDGHIVRVPIPPMDEATRKEMVKIGKKKVEETKVVIREIRRKQNEFVRKQKADGEIAEDVMKKLEKQIQDYTDQFCKETDALITAKEKEIMTV
ncbi:MAG: ribosome recycling factor [Chlamydiae bacterium]|nr:ribosome recycling factor [Chlamydiota bacterium]